MKNAPSIPAPAVKVSAAHGQTWMYSAAQVEWLHAEWAKFARMSAASMRERCAMRLEVASAEYTASATENKCLTEAGRSMMLHAADWAYGMSRAIREVPDE